MAFRASNQATADAYIAIKRQFNATKQYLQQQRALMVASTCSSLVPYAVIQHFVSVLPKFAEWAATPGLAQYAKDQENDPNYDVAAEYVAARNAMISARDQLIAGFPKDVNGWLLYQSMAADGTPSWRNFTAAQLAPVVALIDSVIAMIS